VDDKQERLRQAGLWLKGQRDRLGISVRDMAHRLDVTTQVLYDWQNGRNAISDERAEQIAEVLGMNIIDVRRGLGLWVPPNEEQDEPAENETLVDRLRRIEQLVYDARLAAAEEEARRLTAELTSPGEGEEGRDIA
jgi:transcriptional regulator with XRE-family HTH domain